MDTTVLAGLGYRRALHSQIADHLDEVDFLEVTSDHYLEDGDLPANLDEMRDHVPLVLHGVGLSVGTAAGLDDDYLQALAGLARGCGAQWCSDHLSFTRVPDIDTASLLPLWFSEDSLQVVCRNIAQVQEALCVPFLVENITYYFRLPGEMGEAEFIAEVLRRTDCGLLLDVNNLYTNAINHGYDPYEFLDRIPLDRVLQIHLAGGHERDGILIDSHSKPAPREVLSLLGHVLGQVDPAWVSVEWDSDVPDFAVLLGELAAVREIGSTVAELARSV